MKQAELKRINVGIQAPIHGRACIAATISNKTLQDFMDEVADSAADKIIKDFKSGKTSRHSRRDTTAATSK